MKKIFFCLLALTWMAGSARAEEPTPVPAPETAPAASSLAQAPLEMAPAETLFSGNIHAHGGYAGLGSKITSIDGKPEFMAGGRLAYIVNHSFLIGFAGYGLASDDVKRTLNGEDRRLRMGYGGMEFGYVFASNSLLHLTLQALVGAGGIGYEYKTDRWNKDHWEYDFQGDGFFVAEPMLYLELNLTRWCRVCLGGGYRYVDGVDESAVGLNSKALSGPSGELLFKFGWF